MAYSIFELAWFFLIYACLGWCAEVIFHICNSGKFVNRGFLNGPVCPIYGAGVLIILLCLSPISYNFMLLFAGSVLLTSALEFVTGFVLERFFHQKWWDYSNVPLNIKGYVCLKFSLLWGVACVFIVKVVHPIVERLTAHLLTNGWLVVLAVLYAGFLADVVVTLIHVLGLSKRIRALAALEEAAEEHRRSLLEKRSRIQLRLIRAFPDLEKGRFGIWITGIREAAEAARQVKKQGKGKRKNKENI